jgi:hypothetical protein
MISDLTKANAELVSTLESLTASKNWCDCACTLRNPIAGVMSSATVFLTENFTGC